MELVFTCPSCGVQMQIEAEYAGQDAECPECGAAISIPPLHIGPDVVLGGFRLERKLGSGSMGDVYLAEQITMKRKVAVKILPATMTRDPQAVERFLHEVQTLARFEHPNIVTAFDAGEDEGTYYLAMSYVNGEDLDSIVKKRGPMDEKPALEITRKVAVALQFAWQEHQLLHRDVKPENVMIDVLGEIRLMDMGISKSAHEDSNLTMPGVVFGTPHYMSPEQAWSDGPIDFRADLYSLGASLYRLVTGEPPYTGSSQSVFAKLAKPDIFPLPRELRPELSEAADHLIHVMMAPKPEQRYATWDDCIADIQRVLAGQLPAQPRPPREGQAAPAPPASMQEPRDKAAPGLSGNRMQVIQPKSKGRETPKLSLSRTEEIKTAPPQQKGEVPVAGKESRSRIGLRGRGKGAAEAKTDADVPPVANEPVAKGKAKSANTEGAASDGRMKRMLTYVGMAAAVLVVLGAFWGAYIILNKESLPPVDTSGTVSAPPPTTSSPHAAVAPPPTEIVRPATPATGTTTTTAPPPATPTVSAAELRRMVQQELERRQPEIEVDPAAIARQLGFNWPLEKPRMSSEEVIEFINNRAVEEADKRFPLDERRAEFQKEANERYGAFRIGEEITVGLRHGLETRVTGTLYSITSSTIRISDRNVPVRDLTQDDRERLDPETAARNVNNFVDFKMRGLMRERDEFMARYKQQGIPVVHQRAGYVLRNNRYTAAYDIVMAEVEKERGRRMAALVEEVEKKIYFAHGYVQRDGRWVEISAAN